MRMEKKNAYFQVPLPNYIENMCTEEYAPQLKEINEIKIKIGKKDREKGKWVNANCEYERWVLGREIWLLE